MRAIMLAIVVTGLVASGCSRPYNFTGSRLQQGLHELSPEAEIVEFVYTWRGWGWPPKSPERYNYVESWMQENGRLSEEHFSLAISPEPAAWLGAVDRKLYDRGFRFDGANPVRVWSYRAPAEVRQKGDELLAAAMDAIEVEMKRRIPDLPVARGAMRMRELSRIMLVAVEPITTLTPKQHGELTAAAPAARPGSVPGDHPYPVFSYRLFHVFPTLGKIVFIEACLLRRDEPEVIRGVVAEALAAAAELDKRHFAWPKD
jgi:hypothetical protein